MRQKDVENKQGEKKKVRGDVLAHPQGIEAHRSVHKILKEQAPTMQ